MLSGLVEPAKDRVAAGEIVVVTKPPDAEVTTIFGALVYENTAAESGSLGRHFAVKRKDALVKL